MIASALGVLPCSLLSADREEGAILASAGIAESRLTDPPAAPSVMSAASTDCSFASSQHDEAVHGKESVASVSDCRKRRIGSPAAPPKLGALSQRTDSSQVRSTVL